MRIKHLLAQIHGIVLFLAVSTGMAVADEATSPFTIIDAWIAEAPPTSKVMAGYMTIKNNSQNPVKIVRAESELFSSIEFHETIHEEGLAKMIRHDSLNIPAGESIALKRGGQHLMLFNPKQRLVDGDRVVITLSSENNQLESVSFTVKKVRY